MNSPLPVAAYQMATAFDVRENARKIHEAIDECAAGHSRLLVTPECALSGYLPPPDLDFDLLRELEAEIVAHAADADLYLALGTTTERNGDWLNTAKLFSPTGRPLATYDKTELTGADKGVFAPGKDLPVFEIGNWTVGLQICFDMRFPENWRILRQQGATVILHLSSASRSSGWKVPVLEGTIRCRAAENGMFVVSANDAREPQMLVSAICDPVGKHLAHAEENREMIIEATLDASELTEEYLSCRRTDLWNRPEYRRLLLE